MIAGDYVVISCPHCGQLEKYRTMMSGNTFDADAWSDGYYYAPMMIFSKDVVACQHCHECYWLKDAKRVGTYYPFDDKCSSQYYPSSERDKEVNPDFVASPVLRSPDLAGYYQALEKGLARTIPQEIRLRSLAWWEANKPIRAAWDRYEEETAQRMRLANLPPYPIRKRKGKCPKLSGQDKKNLRHLIKILDPSVFWERYLIAEIYRELSHFDKAVEMLKGFDFGSCQWLADKVLQLAEAEKSHVALLSHDT